MFSINSSDWPLLAPSESGAVPVSFLFSDKNMEVRWVFSINGLHGWVGEWFGDGFGV